MRDPDFFLKRYAPVTTSFSIVSASFDEVLDHWLAWHRRTWEPYGFNIPDQRFNQALDSKLDTLLPLDRMARLITETRDGRIAIFANYRTGSDGSPDADYLADYYKRQRVRVVMVKDDIRGTGTIGSTQFDWIDCGAKIDHWMGHKFRSVAAHKEGRWEWHENGEPFPWEETETYKEKRIKDRLTPEMVERYCSQFGIDLFDPDYYAGRAVLVRLKPPARAGDPGFAEIEHYPNQ